jgi:hypothetical protein
VESAQENAMRTLLLIIVILLLFGGGGGYYGYFHWGPVGGGGFVGIVGHTHPVSNGQVVDGFMSVGDEPRQSQRAHNADDIGNA